MKVYSGTITDAIGRTWSQRFLLTAKEFSDQTTAGILPADTCEVIGLQDAANIAVANFEAQTYRYTGGRFQ